MYYYIVDPGKISQSEFERVQNQLYSSISEFRVSGEVARVTSLRTVNQLVENAFTHNAKTIVAVGSDETLQAVINAIGSREIVIGFVPIGKSDLGELLGVKSIPQAAKTLGARRIEELDLGSANGNLFLSKLAFGAVTGDAGWLASFNYRVINNVTHLPMFEIKFSADNRYEGSLKVVGGVILNCRTGDQKNGVNPTDGYLDVLLLSQLSAWESFKFRKEIMVGEFDKIPGSSVIHVKHLEISSPEGLPLRADSAVITKTPAIIDVKPKALKIIVGKERTF